MAKYCKTQYTGLGSLGESKFDATSGFTEFSRDIVVNDVVPIMRSSSNFVSKSSTDAKGNLTIDTESASVDLEVTGITLSKIWRGRVIEVKASSFIAQLVDTSNLGNITRVEINSSFPGIGDIKSYELYSQFVIEQTNVDGIISTSIRKSSIRPMNVEVRRRIVSAQMKRFSYLFGEEDV